jgi:hypothetical protein
MTSTRHPKHHLRQTAPQMKSEVKGIAALNAGSEIFVSDYVQSRHSVDQIFTRRRAEARVWTRWLGRAREFCVRVF